MPAEVNWREPRLRISVFPIESLLLRWSDLLWRGEGNLLFKFAGNDVGEDLEFAVGVGAEPCAGIDSIFVDHAQGAVLLVVVVMVPGIKVRMRTAE